MFRLALLFTIAFVANGFTISNQAFTSRKMALLSTPKTAYDVLPPKPWKQEDERTEQKKEKTEMQRFVEDLLRVFHHDSEPTYPIAFAGEIGYGPRTAYDALPPKPWKPSPITVQEPKESLQKNDEVHRFIEDALRVFHFESVSHVYFLISLLRTAHINLHIVLNFVDV